jgi:hypothetical protein
MSDEELIAYFDAAAVLLGLQPLAEHRDEALAAFRVLAAEARLVTEFPLPAAIEAAPRFVS